MKNIILQKYYLQILSASINTNIFMIYFLLEFRAKVKIKFKNNSFVLVSQYKILQQEISFCFTQRIDLSNWFYVKFD